MAPVSNPHAFVSGPASRRFRRQLAVLILSLLALYLLRGPIERLANAVIQRWAARRAVATWGLAPTRENVDLYLGSDHSRALDEQAFNPLAGSQNPVPDCTYFSDHWSYGQLFQNGRLAIGIYVQDRYISPSLQNGIRDFPVGPGKTISIRWLRSRQELVDSFARDAIVLYFGHSNYGKGILFDPRSGETPIPMGRAILVIPQNHLSPSDEVLEHLDNGLVRIRGSSQGLQELDVRCKVFAYLGCRSDFYFREVWSSHFPNVDFVATLYVAHAVKAAPEIVRHWITGLQQGRSLADIVDAMNQGQSAAILFGRMNEVTRYHNPDRHPDHLFTY